MPPTLESLGIDKLSVEERLKLIDLIWDSLPQSFEPNEIPEWYIAELADGLLRFVGLDVAQDCVAPLARIAVTVASTLEMEHGFSLPGIV